MVENAEQGLENLVGLVQVLLPLDLLEERLRENEEVVVDGVAGEDDFLVEWV